MRRILIIATLLLLPGICLVAQQFPVQVTPQLVAPYTLQVSEYYSPGASGSKLNLLLLLRDFNKPSLQVRLRMSITGQSVAIATREDVAFTPITIESGSPRYIDPTELAQYFNANNLTFSGITQAQYEQTGKLPEGFYTFCFEVVEANTGQTVSNKGCTIGWLTLSDPPMLNLPRKAESVVPAAAGASQNVLFQWTPRHTANPTAFNTDYIISIIELPLTDTTISPEAAFASYEPNYIDSTNLTTYLLDGSKPFTLREGYRYAWRVRAKAKNGTQELAMFRNEGYSETFWFTYKANCPIPAGVAATPQGQRVDITWVANTVHLDYRVEYREKGNADAEWFTLGNNLPRVSVTDLKPSMLYEYRVGGACDYGVYVYSPLQQFTTNSETATTVPECGIDPNPAPTDQPLLQTMNPGDTIKAGDFNVIATEVSGQGSFTGKGYVQVSWLANMKVAVRFNNIGVATDKKLKTGTIETTYDPTESGIESLDQVISDVAEFYNNTFGSNWNQFTIDTYNGTISSVTTNPDGSISVNGNNGSETVPAGKNYIVSDFAGHTYYISEGGQVTQAEGPKGTPIGRSFNDSTTQVTNTNTIPTGAPVITFSRATGTKYAMDGSDEYLQTGGKLYEKLATGAAPYFVGWKLLQTGQDEFLTATVSTAGIDDAISLDSIHFKRTDGTIIPATRSGNTWPITVKGRLNLYTDALWAVVNQYPGTDSMQERVLGKISLINVDKIKRYAAIVPVNGQGAATDAAQIQTTLNNIYSPFAIEWEVKKNPNLIVNGYDVNQALKVDRKFLNLTYGTDLSRLIDAYGRQNDDTSILFMVNKPDPADADGYMALGNKYGFLFLKGSTQANASVMAHELGHGVFQLPHIFGDNDADQGKTSNLMDYSGVDAKLLCMDQWKQMHDTRLRIRFGQSADDGELASLNNMSLLEGYKVNGYYTFISPAGKLISVPDSVTQVTFTTGDVWAKGNCSEEKFEVAPLGTLYSFRLNDVYYRATKSCNTNDILGYKDTTTGNYYVDDTTYGAKPSSVIIGIPVMENGQIDFAVGKVPATIDMQVSSNYNKAGGFEQQFDFLVNSFKVLYSYPDKVKLVYAALSPDLRKSPEAMDFLLQNAEYAKFGQENGVYVFAHAYQIADYPDIYNNSCGVKYERIVESEAHEYVNQLPKDDTRASINYIENAADWFKFTTIRWRAMGLSRYHELHNSIRDINKLTAITNITDLDKELAKFSGNDCVWKEMDITNRFHVLKTILLSSSVNDSWLGNGNNREYYVTTLLKTIINTQDKYAILDSLMKDNYSLLLQAWDKMDLGNLDEFVATITKWILERNPIDNVAFFSLDNNTSSCGAVCNKKYFTLYEYASNDLRLTQFSGSISSDGLITFSSNVNFKTDGKWAGQLITYTGKPDEMVGLSFAEGFEYEYPGGSGEITAGRRLVVPLIWAYWFQHRVNIKDAGLKVLRLGFDVLTILSGGTGTLAMKAVEVSLAAADFVITANKTGIVDEYGSAGKSFIDVFDAVQTVAVGLPALKNIITYSGGKIGLFVSKIKSAYQEIKSNPGEFLKFRTSLISLAEGINSLVVKAGEKIANLQNMYNALIDQLGFIYLQEKFSALVQSVSLSIRNTKYAILISGGMEIQIASGEYINGIFKLKGGYQWLPAGKVGTTIGYIEEANYIRNALEETGTLEIVLLDGKYYFKTPNPVVKLLDEGGLLKNLDAAKRLEVVTALNKYDKKLLEELHVVLENPKYAAFASEFIANPELLDYFNTFKSSWTGKYAVKLSIIDNEIQAGTTLETMVNDAFTAAGFEIPQYTTPLGTAFDREYVDKAEAAFETGVFTDMPHLEPYYNKGYRLAVGQVKIKTGVDVDGSVGIFPDCLLFKVGEDGLVAKENGLVFGTWHECKIRWDTKYTNPQKTVLQLLEENKLDITQVEFEVRTDLADFGLPTGQKIIIDHVEQFSVLKSGQMVSIPKFPWHP